MISAISVSASSHQLPFAFQANGLFISSVYVGHTILGTGTSGTRPVDETPFDLPIEPELMIASVNVRNVGVQYVIVFSKIARSAA